MYKSKSIILKIIFLVNIITPSEALQVAVNGEFLYPKHARIKNLNDHFRCEETEAKKCMLVDSLSISESNDFNCHNENIRIEKINDLADSDPESKGYIVPWKFQNQIVTEQKSSDICKLIRK